MGRWTQKHNLLMVFVLLLLGCPQSKDDDKVPYGAPLWGEPPGERILMADEALSVRGDLRTGRFENRQFQGFRLYGGRYTTVTLELETESSGVDPVLVVYGPRVSGDIWGSAVTFNDDGGRGLNARINRYPLGGLGEFLVVVTTYGGGVGDYTLRVSCLDGCDGVVPCPELACFEEEACALGYQIDARGCRSCACFAECERPEDCGPSKICVGGRCLDDCQCQDEFEPVCGEDGSTYSSSCEAACLGATVAGPGACSAECSPTFTCDLQCPFGFVLEAGCPVCACEQDPCSRCDEGGVPVCTLNGLTLGNSCTAECEGEVVAYAGRCEPECPRWSCGLECAAGFARDDTGCVLCECARPVCPDLLEPVCGTNGVTFDNDCERERAGVKKAFDGACPPLCEVNEDCPNGLRCSPLDEEACAMSEACRGSCVLPGSLPGFCAANGDCPLGLLCQAGRCEATDNCSPQYDPVCSKEGRTYLNGCYAAQVAEVESFRPGACCSDDLLDACDLQCDNGKVVDGDGCAVCQCREVPPCACLATNNPVCGSDNRTYASPCEARCAGAEILERGACP